MDPKKTCRYCESLTDHGSSRSFDPFDIFHTECHTCSPLEAQNELCAACQHLRLRHVFSCKPKHDYFQIQLGTFRDIDEVQDCTFHRVIQSAVRIWAEVIRPKEVPITSCKFFLEFIFRSNDMSSVFLETMGGTYFNQFKAFDVYAEASAEWSRVLGMMAQQRFVQSMVDWKRVKDWISFCTDHHFCCSEDNVVCSNVLSKSFRVVDVYERRIVHPASTVRFVALSYVWGKHPDETQLVAKSSTLEALQQKDGLPSAKMPSVIEEAIQVCRHLGERYLWVDRLSIIQDDLEDKQKQIKSMAAIYSRASFTLVVACGNDMQVKFPGLGIKRHFLTEVTNIGSIRIRNSFPSLGNMLDVSVWATRGWTFQEKLLSKRKLYITPTEMIWSCHKGFMHENNLEVKILDDPFQYLSRQDSLLPFGRTKLFKSYVIHSEAYNDLSLTYASDVYNAFSAVLTALYPSQNASTGVIYSLPLQDFDAALLWSFDGHSKYARRISNRTCLPSWSWSSVSGKLQYLPFYGSLIQWSFVSARKPSERKGLDGSLTNSYLGNGMFMAWHTDDWMKANLQMDYSPACLYMALAVSQGCMNSTSMDYIKEAIQQTSFEDLAKDLAVRWPTYSSYWKEVFRQHPPSSMNHTFPDDELYLLRTQAQTAALKLSVHSGIRKGVEHPCMYFKHTFDILNLDRKRIGILTASPTLEDLIDYEPTDRLTARTLKEQFATQTFKAMALSIGFIGERWQCFLTDEQSFQEWKHEDFEENEYFDMTYRDGVGKWLYPIPVVNVMVIGERDGYSYRISIGQILLRHWVELDRQFEDIMLC